MKVRADSGERVALERDAQLCAIAILSLIAGAWAERGRVEWRSVALVRINWSSKSKRKVAAKKRDASGWELLDAAAHVLRKACGERSPRVANRR